MLYLKEKLLIKEKYVLYKFCETNNEVRQSKFLKSKIKYKKGF